MILLRSSTNSTLSLLSSKNALSTILDKSALLCGTNLSACQGLSIQTESELEYALLNRGIS